MNEFFKKQVSDKTRNIIIAVMVLISILTMLFIYLLSLSYARASEEEINSIEAGFTSRQAMMAARQTWLTYFYSDNKCGGKDSESSAQNTGLITSECDAPLQNGIYKICQEPEGALRLCKEDPDSIPDTHIIVENSGADGFNATAVVGWQSKGKTKEARLSAWFSGE
jgi:type II secretory pathway pseudopilin PulG